MGGTGTRWVAAVEAAHDRPAEEAGPTETAAAELKEIVGHVSESPKLTGLVLRILLTMPDDAPALDFFAGSGTTATVAWLTRRTRDPAPEREPSNRPARVQRRNAAATVADTPGPPARGCGRHVGGLDERP